MADSQAAKLDKPDPAKQEKSATTSWLSSIPRWGRIALIVLALILAAFAGRVALNSQSLVGSVHQRNFHDLDVAVQRLETWPTDMKLVANNRYVPNKKVKLPDKIPLTHPEIGPYEIRYDCESGTTFRRGEKAGQGTVFFVSGTFKPEDKTLVGDRANIAAKPTGEAKPVCYSTEVPLDRLIDLDEAAPDFSHLLILAGDGSVVAQVGKSVLPITQIAEFAPPSPLIGDLTAKLLADKQAPSAPVQVKLGDAGGSEVVKKFAGNSFRAYVKPFRIEGQSGACLPGSEGSKGNAAAGDQNGSPTATATAGGSPTVVKAVSVDVNAARATADVAAPASQGAKQNHRDGYCYAVGLMPESRLRSAWLAPPPATLVAFGLLLLVFVALLPLIHLLLIGHAESVSFVEAVGIVIGLQVAAAIGMLAVLFFTEAAAERQTVRREALAVATRMERQADDEIKAVLTRILAFRKYDGVSYSGCEDKGEELLDCKPASDGLTASRTIGSILVVGRDGTRPDKVKKIAFDGQVADRQDVSDREYFRALLRGDTLSIGVEKENGQEWPGKPAACNPVLGQGAVTRELRYTLGRVRSQIDGISKTIFSLECNPVADGLDSDEQPDERYLTGASQLYAFLAPVLPDPMRFLVVDLGDPRLPVIFHHNRYRSGTENFAERVEGGATELAALRAIGAGDAAQTVQFTLRYDGAAADFAAVPLHHANWAVLVYAPRDEVDLVAATSALRAIVDWFSLALLGLAFAVARMWYDPEHWRHYWPDEADGDLYGKTRDFLLAGFLAAFCFVALAAGGASPVWVGLLIALLCWSGSVFWFNRQLSKRPQAAKALSPKTERDYGWLCMTMLLCVAVVPMFAMWTDARVLSKELADTRLASAAVRAIDQRNDRLNAVLKQSPLRDKKDAASWIDEGFPDRAETEPGTEPAQKGPATTAPTFARLLSSTAFFLPEPHLRRCEGAAAGVWLCLDRTALGPRLSKGVATVPRHTDWSLSGLAWFFVGLLLAAIAILVATLLLLGLRAMMGFGVPLGAVKLRPFKRDNILPRTLLVAPQTPVRNYYTTKPDDPWKLDLADILLATPNEELWDYKVKAKFEERLEIEKLRHGPACGFRLIVTGLSLILRDQQRRRAALKILETADRKLEADELTGIIIISDLSPLERILDAFDNEEASDASALTTREELRWARLMQRFNTKQFSPVEHIKMDDPRVIALVDKRPPIKYAKAHGAHTLIQELRWIPAIVIDSLIPNPPEMKELDRDTDRYPINDKIYQAVYTRRVVRWAAAQKMPSPAAAIDYLRTTLIEHYEQCWAASTMSERLVLDAIARGHFVNMRNAMSLQALVRRGLVILDPAPRLTNLSFAQFVRQIERPDTLRKWRERQPKSGWFTARLPVLIAVIAGGVFLSVGAAESGQQLSALFAMLVAGGPTLVNLMHRAVRPAG